MLRSIEANEEGFAERDGVRVHYQVFGEGEQAVLLLPTWSIVHSDFWRNQVPHLAASHTVIAFDGRGNGGSDRPAESLAYAECGFADDAIAVLDAIGIDKAAIVSASQGGSWGLVLAAEVPERIPAAVFIAPDLPFGPGHPDQERANQLFDEKLEEHDGWLKWNRHYWRADWPGFLEFFFSNCFTEPDSRSEIDHFFEMGMETDPDTIIATIQAPGLDESTAERLAASIRIPTLVIHGDHDAITPLHRGKTLARLGGAEMVVLSGSGHEPQCRVPERVNGMLDEFLSRHFRAI